MKSVNVFYRLKKNQYYLQFENRTAFVEKEKWNMFIKDHYNRKNGLSVSGGINIEKTILEKMITE